jgi:hypothetical protein
MKLPTITPSLVIGGTLGVIAVALGVRMITTRNEPGRQPMLGPGGGMGQRSENGRGHYGHKKKHDGDHDDHDDKHHKKHKHHEDDHDD